MIESQLEKWELLSVPIRAKHIRPHLWGIICRMPNDKFILNEIVYRRVTEDKLGIMFGLESHNTFLASFDEEVRVVPMNPGYENHTFYEHSYQILARDRNTIGQQIKSCQASADKPAQVGEIPTFHDPFDSP